MTGFPALSDYPQGSSHDRPCTERAQEMAEKTSASRPNIIFFFSDQQRWDTLGCYGQKLNVTPNLDRMAVEGVRFENAFTCQPVCGPARACLQTGRYATQTGNFRNGIALDPRHKTIANHFSQAGYEVAYIGKWHLASTQGLGGELDADYKSSPVPPERRGGYRDYWLASDVLEFTSHGYGGYMFDGSGARRDFPEGRFRADCLGDWAIEYLEGRSDERPFFLFLSFIEPHHQNDRSRYEGPAGSRERFADFEVPGDLAGTGGDWRENYPDYLGCCHSLDFNLGRLRQALGEFGIADDTLIIYTCDHGSHFRTRNSEYKRSCHEASIRIPMVACGPGFTGGRVVSDIVSLIDVPPTLLRAGGIAAPVSMQGRPLQETAGGAPADWPEEAFVQISESEVARAIRTKRWKYSVSAPGKDGAIHPASDLYVEEFLYDLDADPHERTNLVVEEALADVRAGLRRRLMRRIIEAGEREPEILPAGETRP